MFSRWIVNNITFARLTLHYRKTRIPFGDQLVICGQYLTCMLYCFNKFNEFVSVSYFLKTGCAAYFVARGFRENTVN
jgi:hypothetical protein